MQENKYFIERKLINMLIIFQYQETTQNTQTNVEVTASSTSQCSTSIEHFNANNPQSPDLTKVIK